MSRIEGAFATKSSGREALLVAYLTAGAPSAEETVDLVAAAIEGGADIIELGVPFSDPLGDGPVVQASSQAALAGGMTLARTLGVVRDLRAGGVITPIALMGYCNPFLRYGIARLFDDAAVAGVDGFIVPDLPPQEADEWLDGARRTGLDMVFFAARGTRPQRLAYTVRRGSGFLYCLARDGVTGADNTLDEGLCEHLARLRELTTLPLAVGFGISRPDQIRALRPYADAVIVGSALVQRVADEDSAAARDAALRNLVAELKDACR